MVSVAVALVIMVVAMKEGKAAVVVAAAAMVVAVGTVTGGEVVRAPLLFDAVLLWEKVVGKCGRRGISDSCKTLELSGVKHVFVAGIAGISRKVWQTWHFSQMQDCGVERCKTCFWL